MINALAMYPDGEKINVRGTNLYPQENWNSDYAGIGFEIISATDPVRRWFEHFVPETQTGTCLEFGCFPGKYLSVFGEHGYQLNGLDLTPRVETDLKNWLIDRHYRVGFIERSDIWKFETDQKFDVVCSFGLIEHFVDWPKLLVRHADFVAPGGLLIISTPNFRGIVQRVLHELADIENLRKHYLPAMDPLAWSRVLAPELWEIQFCGWFGGFEAWVGDSERNFLEKALLKAVRNSVSLLKWLPDSSMWSVCCGIVAKRR